MLRELLTRVLAVYPHLSISWATSLHWEVGTSARDRLVRPAFLRAVIRQLGEYHPECTLNTVHEVRLVSRQRFTGCKNTYPYKFVSVGDEIFIHIARRKVESGLISASSG